MRRRARPAAALAALAAAASLTAASPLTASAEASPTPTPSKSAASPSPSPTPTQPPAAQAAVGGRLMASTGTVVHYPSSKSPRVPNVPASAWVIANANTGQVLAAKDPHGLYGPASTLKVLTAITLIPHLNPNAWVLTSKLAASAEPSKAGLVAGRRYQVKALFTALLTISANDAAVALAQATGSFAKGMAMINAEAHHLQAYDVVAKEPNGLPAPGQVVSAYDEALIARQALQVPAFMKYDSTVTSKFEVKPKHWETLVNQNALLTQYRGGIGGKIGWTKSSAATYIGLARRNGVTLIVTVLHCKPLAEVAAGEQLLNWGFAMNGRVAPVGELVPPLGTRAAASATRHQAAGSVARGPASNSNGPATAYAVGAGVVACAGIGLGGVVGTRRRRRRLR